MVRMKTQSDSPAEIKISELMKRVRRLGLDSLTMDGGEISPAQLALVDWIAANPGCEIQDLADGLSLASPTVSISVRKMEKKGIVGRKKNPTDGRSIQLFLTDYGNEIHARYQTFHRRKFQRLLSGLTEGEQKTLIDLLERALGSDELN